MLLSKRRTAAFRDPLMAGAISHTVLIEMAFSQEWWQQSSDSKGDYSYGVDI
jgi:hypothetical protein